MSRDFKAALAERALVVNHIGELARFAATHPEAFIGKLQFVAGHVGLADIEYHLKVNLADCFSFSLVRDPVDRALSLYLFIRRNPQLDPAFSERLAERDFDEFVRLAAAITPLLSNRQCVALSGQQNGEAAIQAVVDRYQLVGDLSRFDDVHSIVRRAAGNVVPVWSHARAFNVAPRSTSPEDILRGWKPDCTSKLLSSYSRRIIEEYGREDYKLLDFVRTHHGGLYVSEKSRAWLDGDRTG